MNSGLIGKRIHYWTIKDINKASGYMRLKKVWYADILSFHTAKKTKIYFDDLNSLSDILLNLEH